jgi:preprotein translocase subunit SecY
MTSGLARRIAFTLGALLIYRLGTYIPVPGIKNYPQLPGGSIAPVSIFALWILPYFTAAILIQLASMASSKLSGLSRGGEAGRRKIARYTIGLAILLTGFQAFAIASGLQNVPNLVSDPGGLFLLSTTVTLTGGTAFLIWLSEQITVRGIGNGLALLLFAGVAAKLPSTVASTVKLTWQGTLSVERVSLLTVLWVALVGLVVFIELARRHVPVEFAARTLGDRLLPARSSHLSLKLNSAGLIPTIVGSWLYLIPLWIAGIALGQASPLLATAFDQLAFGHFGHMMLGSIAIVIVAFFYTSFVVDPDYAADSLRQHGAVIPGIEPGEPTAEHLDRVVSITTCIGAIYLTAIFLIPELLLVYGQTPFYLGGASVLVVVCTVLDIETQVRGQSLTEPGGERG